MAERFQNKYRIASARLQSWDYSSEGMYFITICTKNRQCYFGEIVEAPSTTSLQSKPQYESQMQLSEIGKMAESEWLKTLQLRPDMNLELDAFQVMPNHFHSIIIIGENEFNRRHAVYRRDAMHRVSTTTISKTKTAANQFAPQSKNLGSIVRGYKSAVTTYARKNNIAFDWQARFHDHIIRSKDEYHHIVNYILNNVANWQKDKFYNS